MDAAFLSAEGLKLAGRPMDAAFRHPLAVIFGRLDLFTLWRSSSGRPAGRCSLSLCSEGLKLEGLPMDAAFRHPLAVIHGGDLWPSGSVYPLAVIIRTACRWMQRFIII